jgi:Ca-activated chloride channel family protein
MIQDVRRILFATAIVLGLGGWTPLRTTDDDVERGNQAYAEGRWDDAIEAYQEARKNGVDEAGLEYDIGTAMLKKAETADTPEARAKVREDAMTHLERAAKSKDPRVRSRARYNQGTVHMQDGKLDEAIEAYKDALRTDPEMEDARVNLELAMRKREKKQQQQQQQQGQGQGQQDQQQQGQGQQQDQQQQGQGQGQQQQDQQQQGQGQQDQQQQDQQQQDQQQQGQGQGQQDQQQQDQQQQGQGQQDQPQQDQQQKGQGQGQGQDDQQQQQDDQPFDPSQRQRAPQESPSTPEGDRLRQLEEEARRLRREQMRNRARDTSRLPSGQDW